MNDVVDETLIKWRQSRFGYDNQNDCMLSLATYLVDCGYPDFGGKFRNTFTNMKGAYAHVERYGSEQAIIDETGLKPTISPLRGDILLIEMKQKFACLCLGDTLALRTQRGVIELRLKNVKVVKAWKVERCPH